MIADVARRMGVVSLTMGLGVSEGQEETGQERARSEIDEMGARRKRGTTSILPNTAHNPQQWRVHCGEFPALLFRTSGALGQE